MKDLVYNKVQPIPKELKQKMVEGSVQCLPPGKKKILLSHKIYTSYGYLKKSLKRQHA